MKRTSKPKNQFGGKLTAQPSTTARAYTPKARIVDTNIDLNTLTPDELNIPGVRTALQGNMFGEVDLDKAKALVWMNRNHGNPKINNLRKDNLWGLRSDGSPRAYYQPNSNIAYVETLNDYFAELSHSDQFINKKTGALDYSNVVVEPIEYAMRGIRNLSEKLYDKYTYKTPGTLEWDAHKVIEPELKTQYEALRMSQQEKNSYLKRKLSFQEGGVNTGVPASTEVPPVKLEKGEIYRDTTGKLNRVKKNAPSHNSKSGGVELDNVASVISDSYSQVESGKRKNNVRERLVKFDADQINDLALTLGLDVKAKKSLSPTKVFDLLKESKDKLQKEYLSKTDVDPKSKFAENSLTLNFENAAKIPTDQDLYDAVFAKQEEKKGIVPELFNEGAITEESQFGGVVKGKRSSFEQWKNTLPSNLRNTDTTQYNLRGAYEGGLQPQLHQDGTYHLGSRNPQTGELLKYPSHPTYNLMLQGEQEAGYEVYEQNGKMYSRKKPKLIQMNQFGGMVDDVSMQGYRFDSPYQNAPSLTIQGGNIDMSATPQDLALIPIKNQQIDVINAQIGYAGDPNNYSFDADQVLEVPLNQMNQMQNGGTNQPVYLNKRGIGFPNISRKGKPQAKDANGTEYYLTTRGTFMTKEGREFSFDRNTRTFIPKGAGDLYTDPTTGTRSLFDANEATPDLSFTENGKTKPAFQTQSGNFMGEDGKEIPQSKVVRKLKEKKAQVHKPLNTEKLDTTGLSWETLNQPNVGAIASRLPLEDQNLINKDLQTQALINDPEFRRTKNTLRSDFTVKRSNEPSANTTGTNAKTNGKRFDFSSPELDVATGLALADSYNTVAPIRQRISLQAPLQRLIDPTQVINEIDAQSKATLQNVNPNSTVGQAFVAQIDANTQRTKANAINQIQTQNAQIDYQNALNVANANNQEMQMNLQFDKRYYDESLQTQENARQQRMSTIQNWAMNMQRQRAFKNNLRMQELIAPYFVGDDLENIGTRNNKQVVFSGASVPTTNAVQNATPTNTTNVNVNTNQRGVQNNGLVDPSRFQRLTKRQLVDLLTVQNQAFTGQMF